MLKNKRVLIVGGASVFLLILFFIFRGSGTGISSDIMVPVTIGEFIVDVNTTGELEAKNSTSIMGPSGLRNYRIYQVNIQNIIDEGTYVKKGQYIARLDPSELTTRVKDTQLEVEEKESQFIQTQLDTTLQMRESRDELINLEYAVEEKRLVLEQSQFEPPATIKQAEIEVNKAKRAFEQAKENYEIKRQQNVAKMQEVAANRKKVRLELQGMMDLQENFIITAPEDGMLIYRKGWDGKPIKEGSQISAWDPVVATLPDLSSMNSVTYVNEVDIRRIAIGQKVDIGLDAFPDKRLTGLVKRVANVGEQRPNSDAKVFQVTIEIDKIDDSLRPGMTTSNKIFTNVIPETIFIPLECLHNQEDSITYVYLKQGLGYIKQEVQVGETNANSAQILLGISEGQQLYLSIPNGGDEQVSLLPELDGKRGKKQEETPAVKAPEPEQSRKRKPNA
ncbi:MAG: HlyD family efflux transporter periplasmic adaptor subunit [Marinoscillum sp.]|uniref:efflux RND transporter periplasmic adaptor subunit n=1 Tax=Marinoscillum sp. TaxID=2024838 RepID=UPI0032FCC836